MINKVPPVAAKPTPEGAVFAFTYLSFTGTGMACRPESFFSCRRM